MGLNQWLFFPGLFKRDMKVALIVIFFICISTFGQEYKITLNEGHRCYVSAIAFSPDDEYIATGDACGEIKIWDIENQVCVQKLLIHPGAIDDLLFHPSGDYLVSTSYDGLIKIWDIKEEKLLNTHQAETSNYKITLSENGNFIFYYRYNKQIKHYEVFKADFLSGNIVRKFDTRFKHFRNSLLKNDRYMAIWDNTYKNRKLLLFDVQVDKILVEKEGIWEKFFATELFLHPGEDKVYLFDAEDSLMVLDYANGAFTKVNDLSLDKSYSMDLSPDGSHFVIGYKSGSKAELYTTKGLVKQKKYTHSSSNLRVKYSFDSEYFFSGGGLSYMYLHKIGEEKPVKKFHQPYGNAEALCFNSADTRLAMIYSSKIRIWDINKAESTESFSIKHYHPSHIIYTDNDKNLVIGGLHNKDSAPFITKYDLDTKVSIYDHKFEGKRFFDVSKDGTYSLISPSDSIVVIVDNKTGRFKSEIGPLEYTIACGIFFNDGRRIVIRVKDQLQIWDFTDKIKKEILETKNQGDKIAVSEDDNHLLYSEGYNLIYFNLITGAKEHIHKHNKWIRYLSFIENSSTAISMAEDDAIYLWNLKTKECIKKSQFVPTSSSLKASLGNKNDLLAINDNYGAPVTICSISGEEDILEFYNLSGDNWYSISKNGYYNCPEELRKNIYFTKGLEYKDYTEFPERYNRRMSPEEILEDIHPVPAYPPRLVIEDISFKETSGNNILDADESAVINLKIKNSGDGTAYRLTPLVNLSDEADNISVSTPSAISKFDPGEKADIRIPVSASGSLADSKVNMKIEIREVNGFDLYPPAEITFETRKFSPPELVINDMGINDQGGDNKINLSEMTEVTLQIMNRGEGFAQNVNVEITNGNNSYFAAFSEKIFELGAMKPMEYRNVSFTLYTNTRAENLNFHVKINESRNSYGLTKDYSLPINNYIPSLNKLVVDAKEEIHDNTPPPALNVDVDINIPETYSKNNHCYALIIGNEDYKSKQHGLTSEQNVKYAMNDARVFAEYCEKTLGIPQKQIKLYKNGTLAQINQGLAWINNLAEIEEGKAELIFYYSGHGLPDEKSREPYIIPVDVSASNIDLAIPLSEVYKKLTEHPAKKITVFLDACFSGGARDKGLLLAARPVKVKVRDAALKNNMVVFSSSSGDETSSAWEEKEHGYFTYFLLKKLQQEKGNVTLGELGDYIIQSVRKESGLAGKIQTPKVIVSPKIKSEWEEWELR